MAVRESTVPGMPCWADLMSSDVAKSREFYAGLFGWTADEVDATDDEGGGHFTFRKNGVVVAGGIPKPDGLQVPDLWMTYLATDDIDKTLRRAVAAGAEVHVDATAVGDLGTMAMFLDPTGAAIHVWQPGTHRGYGLVAEHGAVGWSELHTRDHGKAVEFYREVFDWTTETVADTDDFRYTVAVHDGDQQAGIMDASKFLPEGVPSHWSVYFGTDDADDTIARAVELGGTLVMPAEDTPYGRLAVLTDPTGAQFKLVGPNKATPPTA